MNHFSVRKKIAEDYQRWCEENSVKDCAFSVISYLEGKGLLMKPWEHRTNTSNYARVGETLLVYCRGCQHFDSSGYETANEELDPALALGWCWTWKEIMQACDFCSRGVLEETEMKLIYPESV